MGERNDKVMRAVAVDGESPSRSEELSGVNGESSAASRRRDCVQTAWQTCDSTGAKQKASKLTEVFVALAVPSKEFAQI